MTFSFSALSLQGIFVGRQFGAFHTKTSRIGVAEKATRSRDDGIKKSESERTNDKDTANSLPLVACLSSLAFPLTRPPLDQLKNTKTKRKLHRAANAVRAAREKERLAARKARATES